MIRQFVSHQFLVFLLTGGTAAVVNIGSRVLFSRWFGFSSAVILAYLAGMITAFVLAKFVVFRESQQSIQHSIAFFVLVNLVAVVQTWIISMGLAYFVLPSLGISGYALEIAHVIGVAVPVFTSYIGHKRWSFK